MTANDFRKDKYLRATGYNFYVWAAVNVMVTWPLYSALAGAPWPGWLAVLYPFGLIGAGIFLSVLNDNRVQKMCGDPNPTPMVESSGDLGADLPDWASAHGGVRRSGPGGVHSTVVAVPGRSGVPDVGKFRHS